MTIQKFLHNQLERGFTLRRLSKLLGVTPATLSKQQNNQNQRVSLTLARSIYDKFDIELDGFHEDELISTEISSFKSTISNLEFKISSLENEVNDYKNKLFIANQEIEDLENRLNRGY